jgi:hypothetical protein
MAEGSWHELLLTSHEWVVLAAGVMIGAAISFFITKYVARRYRPRSQLLIAFGASPVLDRQIPSGRLMLQLVTRIGNFGREPLHESEYSSKGAPTLMLTPGEVTNAEVTDAADARLKRECHVAFTSSDIEIKPSLLREGEWVEITVDMEIAYEVLPSVAWSAAWRGGGNMALDEYSVVYEEDRLRRVGIRTAYSCLIMTTLFFVISLFTSGIALLGLIITLPLADYSLGLMTETFGLVWDGVPVQDWERWRGLPSWKRRLFWWRGLQLLGYS